MDVQRETKALTLVILGALFVVLAGCEQAKQQETHASYYPGFEYNLYAKPLPGMQTRWMTGENPAGIKGAGGTVNKGAKGRAFIEIAPGEKVTLFDFDGTGIVNHIWMAGSPSMSPYHRRALKLEIFWDDAEKPAVSAPLGDFFGMALGDLVPFESVLFVSPEGKSLNSFVPMPFHRNARIELTNHAEHYVPLWYEVDLLQVERLPEDIMYFHVYWSRIPETKGDGDYVVLPRVKGVGRYLGANVGLIGNPLLMNEMSWFGEGEVKIFLDGDTDLATLVGTGTEDYVGTGFGQGKFDNAYFGSPVSIKDLEKKEDRYAFYRYHIPDPVYFHQDISVTLQTMGNMKYPELAALNAAGAGLEVVSLFDGHDQPLTALKKDIEFYKFYDLESGVDGLSEEVLNRGWANYWRKGDDVSATAYFYLDSPASDLPRYTDPALGTFGIPKEPDEEREGSSIPAE